MPLTVRSRTASQPFLMTRCTSSLDAAKAAMDANDGTVTRETLKDALKAINYDGVTGTVTFNDVNDWERPYLTLKVENGEFVLDE